MIALHPLALESTVFQGMGEELAQLGLRTLALARRRADVPRAGLDAIERLLTCQADVG